MRPTAVRRGAACGGRARGGDRRRRCKSDGFPLAKAIADRAEVLTPIEPAGRICSAAHADGAIAAVEDVRAVAGTVHPRVDHAGVTGIESKREVLANTSFEETRIAILENGRLSELHWERKSSQNIVGNIYKGTVENVLPLLLVWSVQVPLVEFVGMMNRIRLEG